MITPTPLRSGYCSLLHRLVSLSSPPYIIIHVNGAYGQLTGLTSAETLGRTVGDLVVRSSQSKNLVLAACAASSSEGRDVSVDAISKRDDTALLRGKIRVTPIVPSLNAPKSDPGYDARGDIRELSNVTHFSIDFITGESWSEETAASGDVHSRVVG